MSESAHVAYKNSGSILLSLLEAAWHDIAEAKSLERTIKSFAEGVNCHGERPNDHEQRERMNYQQSRKVRWSLMYCFLL